MSSSWSGSQGSVADPLAPNTTSFVSARAERFDLVSLDEPQHKV